MKDKDFKIETTRSRGNGGQKVNTTDSCVIITHIPTGLKERCQDTPSQFRNKSIAMDRLVKRIDEQAAHQKHEKLNDKRNEVIEDSGRIRTYNEQRNEVVDHRTKKHASYDEVLNKGKLDLLR
jgi:protein subunit release factor A